MAAFKVDGDFTTATAVGAARKSFPIEGRNDSFIIEQDYMQTFADFSALALNTPHPDVPTAYLVAETPLQDLGGGIARWTRVYAQVPATYTEPGGNYAYNFIGFEGNFFYVDEDGNPVAISGRDRFTESVPVQITREFFLVGTGQTYATAEQIPVISAQKYYYENSTVPVLALFNPITTGGVTYPGTTPTRTAYEAMVAANAFNIVVEDSLVTRWMGNIWMRETRRVKAK
jgi:hypothetical protein